MKQIKKCTVAILLTFLLLSTNIMTGQATTQFKDLKQGDFGYSEIINLFERGVVTGLPSNEFQPSGKLNRAQAAIMFQRALQLSTPTNKISFKDVKQGVYYTDAAAATMQAGIFKGKSDGSFGPLDELTREQMATLLVRVLNLKPNSSTPVTINDLEKIHPTHRGDVLTLYQNKMTTGKQGNVFDPKGEVTRSEFSVFVVRGLGENLPPKKGETTVPPVIQPPLAGGGGGALAPRATTSYLKTPTEQYDATVNGTTFNYSIPRDKISKLTEAKISVTKDSTMTVGVFINETTLRIDDDKTQSLTQGDNNLNIVNAISKNAEIISLLGGFSATGTLTDAQGNSSPITLNFTITD